MSTFDLYSPIFLIAGGLLSLGYFKLLSVFMRRRNDVRIHTRLEVMRQRFAARSKISWMMLIFGTFWAVQILVERSWAR